MTDHTQTPAEDHPPVDLPRLARAVKSLGRRLLAIADNRLDLLMVEAEEERRFLMSALVLVAVMIAAALVADLTISTLIVVFFWEFTRIWALLVLGVLHVSAAALCLSRLNAMLRKRAPFAASVEQFRKDRAGMEKIL